MTHTAILSNKWETDYFFHLCYEIYIRFTYVVHIYVHVYVHVYVSRLQKSETIRIGVVFGAVTVRWRIHRT